MSLRQRLLLALFGSGLMIVAIVYVARDQIVRRASEAELRSALEARIDVVGRERCEQGPLPEPRGLGPIPGRGPHREPGGPGGASGPPFLGPGGPPRERRPFEVFFFGDDFSPRSERGPSFPAEARAALLAGASFATVLVHERGPEALAGALATGWDSAVCAYAVAFAPMPPPLLSLWPSVAAALAFLLALAGALFVAAASPVRRIRALADGMKAAAASRYERGVAVEGNDEIALLATAFNDAARTARAQLLEVETRERALRDFVAHTTHDVGLPLSVLAGSLSELRERVATGQTLAPALRSATRETQYIASLLHNLGAVAQLETEQTLKERHPVDLGALVERVALRHAMLARDASVELNHAVPARPVVVVGDVTLLEQAANNLVHNAIRYNGTGGHVAVVLDADAARFELKVTDDGPGVSAEELARLGERRFRGGEARSRRPEGTGLGLSIARDVAARHGLQLEFRHREAGGLEAVLSGAVTS
jgi:signal transduction histidine kinase